MEIKKLGIIITIDDKSDDAKKILQGFDYKIENGRIVFTGSQTGFNLEAFKEKLENKTASLKDIREFILKQLL